MYYNSHASYKPYFIYLVKSLLFCVLGTTSLVQNILAYPGLGHSGPLDVEGGGGSSGGECPASGSFTSGGGVIGGTQMSSLPPAMRVRLYELFVQIEREFEILYAENLNLQVCMYVSKYRVSMLDLNRILKDSILDIFPLHLFHGGKCIHFDIWNTKIKFI